MTIGAGQSGVVTAGGNAVAQIQEFSTNSRILKIPAHIGGGGTQYLVGRAEADFTMRVIADEDDTTGQGALVQGATVAIIFRPLGTGSGLPQTSMTAVIESNVRSYAVDSPYGLEIAGWAADGTVDDTPQA